MQQFLDKPSIDFGAVRDGRRSMPLWLDVDLTNAHSIASGSALSINIAGNSFYVDADTVNVGVATLHFQDTNLGNSSAPFVAAPGFVANVPFTQILVENAAQAGKRLRIFYGVDLDFRAGVNASVVSGTVNIGNIQANPGNVADNGLGYGGSYKTTTNMAANTPDTIIAPGANVNGAILVNGCFHMLGNMGYNALIAKASAPANVLDGDVIDCSYTPSGAVISSFRIQRPIRIAAGLGIYAINSVVETNALRSLIYKLL